MPLHHAIPPFDLTVLSPAVRARVDQLGQRWNSAHAPLDGTSEGHRRYAALWGRFWPAITIVERQITWTLGESGAFRSLPVPPPGKRATPLRALPTDLQAPFETLALGLWDHFVGQADFAEALALLNAAVPTAYRIQDAAVPELVTIHWEPAGQSWAKRGIEHRAARLTACVKGHALGPLAPTKVAAQWSIWFAQLADAMRKSRVQAAQSRSVLAWPPTVTLSHPGGDPVDREAFPPTDWEVRFIQENRGKLPR
jgi:hypothetical protein